MTELRGRPGLKIAHLNVRSLLGKVNQLRLDLPESGLDLLTLSETWLTASTEERLTTIQGYNMVRLDRQVLRSDGAVRKGGGLGVYFKDFLDIDATTLKHLNCSNNNLEPQCVVLARPNTKKILLGNVSAT